jgi:hypothetical protein
VLYLSTIGGAQADDPAYFAILYKRHVMQGFCFRRESNHSHLGILKPVINPHQRSISVEFARKNQGNTMLCLVCGIL